MPDYRVALLHKLGMPVTKANLRFLDTWQRFEGGGTHNTATFNFMNTKRPFGGSVNAPGLTGMAFGVQAYPDFATGIGATAATLRNGYYPNILAGLKSGNPYAQQGIGDDLQTWVAGPKGHGSASALRYVKNILGSEATPAKLAKSVKTGKTRRQGPPMPAQFGDPNAARQALLAYFMDSNSALMRGEQSPDFTPYGQMFHALQQQAQAQPQNRPQKATKRHLTSTKPSGGWLQAPTEWEYVPGSHAGEQTANLGWGRDRPLDIMAKPGTKVGAPEDAEVVDHGSAQGGASVKLRTPDGREYWMGHIENPAPIGTQLKKGDYVAVISGRHKNPHLHIAKRN